MVYGFSHIIFKYIINTSDLILLAGIISTTVFLALSTEAPYSSEAATIGRQRLADGVARRRSWQRRTLALTSEAI
jgi:hypothetical protein